MNMKSLFPASTVVDPSPRTGVYEGDLKYGRTHHGELKKHKDYAADRMDGVATNPPAVGLALVQPRDPEVWTKDERVKKAKKEVFNSQAHITHILQVWNRNQYMSLTIGKQRI